MPTVWASVPMQAPTTTSLRRRRFLISVLISFEVSSGNSRSMHLDLADVDEVGDRAVDDEEGEVRAHGLGVHEQGRLQPHLGGELQGRALGALVVRQREGERDLHHAVAGGVAVGPHERAGLGEALVALEDVLHAALRLVGVAAAGHRVAPSSSRVVAGLS